MSILEEKPNFDDYGSVMWEEYLDAREDWLERLKAHYTAKALAEKRIYDGLLKDADKRIVECDKLKAHMKELQRFYDQIYAFVNPSTPDLVLEPYTVMCIFNEWKEKADGGVRWREMWGKTLGEVGVCYMVDGVWFFDPEKWRAFKEKAEKFDAMAGRDFSVVPLTITSEEELELSNTKEWAVFQTNFAELYELAKESGDTIKISRKALNTLKEMFDSPVTWLEIRDHHGYFFKEMSKRIGKILGTLGVKTDD